jgi:CDP-diacylglycerol--glycerol-3-phosphate 3-phosphatidyltransferase
VILNVPNILTLIRLAFIPLLVLAFYWKSPWHPVVVTGIFFLAGITDWFDGYLARRLGQMSRFGAFMDPVADKLIVIVSLVLLVASDHIRNAVFDGRVFTVVVLIIIGREVAVSALREWMAELGQRGNVKVSWIGKWKTGTQMLAIGFLLYGQPLWNLPIVPIGEVLLYLSAVLTLWSMLIYLLAAWPALSSTHEK